MPKSPPHSTGHVVIVGAGPGDPGLITLRGHNAVAAADLIVYDYLVNPQVLAVARKDAELVCLGRHGRDRILSQAEVNERLILAAQAGKQVVRLKSGDPAVFARIGEETHALVEAGVSLEIVPGITAALAAGSHAGIPLTHRDSASAVALVTGHEQDEKTSPLIDYRALASFPGTLVFYMGVTTVGQWSRLLIEGGKSPQTPVAVVRRCSWPDQTVYRTTLNSLPALVEQKRLRPPVIFIVGEVVTAEATVSWFASRPLFGQRIVVTRPETAGPEPLRELLESAGAAVYCHAAIELREPDDWAPLDRAIDDLAQGAFDWVVFSSANGVRAFLDRIVATQRDLRVLGRTRLAAIGPGTDQALLDYHLRADRVPQEYRAEALADALSVDAAGQRFLLIRASRGREVLAERLQAARGAVTQVIAYRSTDVTTPLPEVAADLSTGRIHWVTVTSSAIARSIVQLFGSDLQRTRLASISPVTSSTLRELGFEPAVEAREYTMRGLVSAIVEACGRT